MSTILEALSRLEAERQRGAGHEAPPPKPPVPSGRRWPVAVAIAGVAFALGVGGALLAERRMAPPGPDARRAKLGKVPRAREGQGSQGRAVGGAHAAPAAKAGASKSRGVAPASAWTRPFTRTSVLPAVRGAEQRQVSPEEAGGPGLAAGAGLRPSAPLEGANSAPPEGHVGAPPARTLPAAVPSMPPRGAPSVRVSFIAYSPNPGRRRVGISVDGGPLVLLREGERAAGLEVTRILAEAVELSYDGRRFLVRAER